MASRSARIERCPNNFGSRFAKSGSRTISRVPATVRMISGEKRSRSSALGAKLAGMTMASGRHSQWNIALALVEDLRVRFRHGGQERLRIHSHPDHHDHQRNHARPFARVEIRHVVFDLVAQLTEEHTLIEPEHVARGEDHADRGEDSPGKVSLRGTLQYEKFSDEVIEHRQ